jgi:hypothetical protein
MSGYLGDGFNKAPVRTQGFDPIRNFIHNSDEFGGFGRRYPREMQTVGFEPHKFKQVFHQGKFATGIVITFQVMAFAGMSPGHPDRISAFPQGCQGKFGIHTTRAGDAHHPDVGRVFHAADAGQIGGTITAPVA